MMNSIVGGVGMSNDKDDNSLEVIKKVSDLPDNYAGVKYN